MNKPYVFYIFTLEGNIINGIQTQMLMLTNN